MEPPRLDETTLDETTAENACPCADETQAPARIGGVGRRVLRNTSSSFVRQFVTGAAGVVLVPYIVHHLGVAIYGVWVLAQSVVAYSRFCDLGIRVTLRKSAAEHLGSGEYAKANAVIGQLGLFMWGTALLVGSLSGIGAFALPLCLPLEPAHVRLFQWTFLLVGGQSALGFVSGLWEGTLAAAEDYHVINGLRIAGTLARCAYTVVLLSLGHGLLALLGAQFVVLCVEWAVSYLYLRRRYPAIRLRPRWHGWKALAPLLKFSGGAFVAQVSGTLANDTDKVIVGAILGPAQVAVYQIGYKLYDFARSLFSGPVDVLLPTFSALDARGESSKMRTALLHTSAIMVVVLAAVYLPAMFWGGEVIHLWVGGKFAESGSVLAILSVAMLVSAHNRSVGPALYAIGEYRIPAKVSLVYAVSNVLVSILLCRHLGLLGVAWGTALTAVPAQVYVTWYAAARLRLPHWQFWARPFLTVAACGAAGYGSAMAIASCELGSGWVPLLAKVAAFEITFTVGMWFFGLSRKTRLALAQVLRFRAMRVCPVAPGTVEAVP